MTARILLLFPRVEPDQPDRDKLLGLPLAPLTLARSLIEHGYDVLAVDQNVDPGIAGRLGSMERPLWVGLSIIGGWQIRTGLSLARRIRRRWPDVPIVWGGWNPTLLAHLYEAPHLAPWVDVVVRGRAEVTAVELSDRLRDGRGLDGIAGLSHRSGGGDLVREPDRPTAPDPSHALLPYHLIDDPDAYITAQGLVNYMSSHGCPHRCGFCGIPVGTRTFRPLETELVVEQVAELKQRGSGTVLFYDDNFFTQKARVVDLARRLLESGLGIEWYSNGRLDQVLAFDENELRLLVASGCRSVNVGYETGDQQVADGVHKDIDVESVYEAARRFAAVGLHLSLNFMVGLPGETPQSLVRSLETLKRIHAIQPDMDVCWYMFMAAPGTELWHRLIDEGQLTDPATLEEHARLQPLFLELPWYYPPPPRSVFRPDRRELQAIVWCFYQAYAAAEPGLPWRPYFRLLRRWCKWRYEGRRFGLWLDWRLFERAFVARTALRNLRAAAGRSAPWRAIAARLGPRRQGARPSYAPLTGLHRGT
ncbi:B12-binding domain-containing radical SAM protein [Engelhardtia mirabilis]|uniref:B12-binding domain-containing radical SAM protein n=1 Tax=Engelhardtia mirabilis TaxID=2528011 RepID=UPI0011A17DD4